MYLSFGMRRIQCVHFCLILSSTAFAYKPYLVVASEFTSCASDRRVVVATDIIFLALYISCARPTYYQDPSHPALHAPTELVFGWYSH